MVADLAPVSPDNFNAGIPSAELAQLPEWHMRKWAMAVLLRINGNLLKWARRRAET